MWGVYCEKCGADLEVDVDEAIVNDEDYDGNNFDIICECGATVEIAVSVTVEFTVTDTYVQDEEDGE